MTLRAGQRLFGRSAPFGARLRSIGTAIAGSNSIHVDLPTAMNDRDAPAERRGPHPSARLRDVLSSHRSAILDAWKNDVRNLTHAQGLSDGAVLDHLPSVLQEISKLLESSDRSEYLSLAKLGRAHAVDRLSRGFELDQVILEYRLLRRIIVSTWAQAAGMEISIPELMALDEVLDESIGQAVTQYARSRERLLQGLNQVSEAAAQSHDLSSFLQAMLHATIETLSGIDTAAVFIREGDALCLRAAIGLEEELRDRFSLAIGEGFAGRVASLGEPLALDDAAADPGVKSPALKSKGVRALYGVPLLQQGEVIGVSCIGSRSARELSEESKLLFRTMASRAASFIAKARLQARLREADAVQRMFAEVGRQLGESLDVDAALGDLAHAAVPGIADWCVVYVLTEEGVRRVSMAHVDAEKGRIAEEMNREFPLDLNGASIVARAIRGGKSECVPRISHAMLSATARDAKHLALLEGLDIRSAIAAPLLSQRRTIGAIMLVYSDSGRTYRDEDLVIAEELARRASSAIENARLYREARSAVETRDQLLAIVSHDLRNQLGVMTTSGTLIEELAKAAPDTRIQAPIQALKRASASMQRLLNDLLDTAAIREGRLSLALEECPIDSVLEPEIRVHEAQASAGGITLEQRLDAAGEKVVCDRGRIAQVVANLLGNALRYCARGDRILVWCRREGRFVYVSVSDTGPGIPPEEAAQLFKPYRTMNRAGKSGTGLGLYISKGIVERHGGRIWCRSEVGDGATFTFSLPVAGLLAG